jgi:putative ABC transport system substrate-binding protein
MLKEIAPGVTRAGLLTNPKTNIFDYFVRAARAAAAALAIEIVPLPIESAETDIERAVASFASTPNGALVVPPDPTTIARRDFVVALAARYHLPAVYGYRPIVDAGGLMSYGVAREFSAGGGDARGSPTFCAGQGMLSQRKLDALKNRSRR